MIKAVSQGSNILSPSYNPIRQDTVSPQAVLKTELLQVIALQPQDSVCIVCCVDKDNAR